VRCDRFHRYDTVAVTSQIIDYCDYFISGGVHIFCNFYDFTFAIVKKPPKSIEKKSFYGYMSTR